MRLNVVCLTSGRHTPKATFKTPSGKCEFKSSAAENGNFVVPVLALDVRGDATRRAVDPVPDYIPSYETPHSNPELAKRYPLNMISPKPHGFLNSQYANEPVQQKRQGEQLVLINPKDAKERNIDSGTYVRVWNDRGSFLRARRN